MKNKSILLLSLIFFGSFQLKAQWISPAGTLRTYALSDNIGIGLRLPVVKLHVVGGSDAAPSGGGYLVTGQTTSSNIAIDNNEIMARFNGGVSSLFLNNSGGNVIINGTRSTGNFGVRTSAPAVEAHIFHGLGSGITNGLRLSNSGTNNQDWTFYVQNSNGYLQLYQDGVFMGQFNDNNGGYSSVSDRRLKKDFEGTGTLMPKIMKLDVQKYNFIKSKPGALKEFGLVAQDVEKVFPEIVNKTTLDDGSGEVYTMNYSAFGVLAIKAIQEQEQTIQEQQKIISTLQERLIKVEAAINAVSIINKNTDIINKEINSGSLKIFPNPASESVTLNYKIDKEANAHFLLLNNVGQIIKTIQAPTNGQVQIDTKNLAAGTYILTLINKQQIVEARKMMVQRK